jgi:hypothetical protein
MSTKNMLRKTEAGAHHGIYKRKGDGKKEKSECMNYFRTYKLQNITSEYINIRITSK